MIKDYIEIIKYYALSNISLSYKLIGKVVKIELIKSCPSIILIVSTEIEKYVIKFYTSTANLDLLHNYSIHISNSMRAQTIIVNDFGELYSKVNILDNNYYMVIRNYIRGNKPSFLDLEDVFCFGESLGILHSISDNFSFNLSSSINKKERLDIYIDNIIDLVKNNNSYKLNFGSYLDNLHESISMLSSVFCDNTLLAADTLIHGDISSDNSIMLGNSVCFIDFDDPNTFKGELSLDEINKLTKNLGKSLLNVNLTGGEPFARKDIIDIAKIYLKNTKIQSMYITTNASLPDRIENFAKTINSTDKELELNFQISIDDLPKNHDKVRKINKGGFNSRPFFLS